jgi:hypothetical protein
MNSPEVPSKCGAETPDKYLDNTGDLSDEDRSRTKLPSENVENPNAEAPAAARTEERQDIVDSLRLSINDSLSFEQDVPDDAHAAGADRTQNPNSVTAHEEEHQAPVHAAKDGTLWRVEHAHSDNVLVKNTQEYVTIPPQTAPDFAVRLEHPQLQQDDATAVQRHVDATPALTKQNSFFQPDMFTTIEHPQPPHVPTTAHISPLAGADLSKLYVHICMCDHALVCLYFYCYLQPATCSLQPRREPAFPSL